MTAHDQVLAFVRTYIPYGIGAAAAWLLVTFAIQIPDELLLAITAFLVVVAQNIYYFIIRVLELWVPWLGIFLGWPRQPEYTGIGDLWASVVRTGIPTLVGAIAYIVGVLALEWFGISFDYNDPALMIVGIAVAQALYYAIAKPISDRWPAWRWLLAGVEAPTAYVR